MGKHAAAALFGQEAVARASVWPDPAPVDLELVKQVKARAGRPGLLRSWALAQPWPVFCAVVRLIRGDTRLELLKGETMTKPQENPRKPKQAKAYTVAVRMDPDLVDRLNQYVDRLAGTLPGTDLSRGAVIRMFIEKGLEAVKAKQ